jgi:hypothetical protein
MTPNLKPGDRVRVTANAAKSSLYQPGDKGTVLVGPILRGGGKLYYIVGMDKAPADTTSIILSAGEIELDVD